MNWSDRKGIVLAGGLGTRLHPLTVATSKQLLPVYDKPMIYYPISTLLLAGIRDVLLISTPQALPQFRELLGDGSEWGMKMSYVEQEKPSGIAEALILGEEHLAGGPGVLILGDNIFFGNGLTGMLRAADQRTSGATIFSYRVNDPSAYGIVAVDLEGKALSLEEKPRLPASNLAVTGLYFYDGKASSIARTITPSARGELEITSVNQKYLELGELHVTHLYRGFSWFDAGTVEALLDAADFIRHIELRQGLKVSCPEEICLNNGWISPDEMEALAGRRPNAAYSQYLQMVAAEVRLRNSGSGL